MFYNVAEFVNIFLQFLLVFLFLFEHTGIYQGYGTDDIIDTGSAGISTSRLSGSEFKLMFRSGDAFIGGYISGSNIMSGVVGNSGSGGGGGVTPISSMATGSIDIPPHSPRPTPPLQRRLAKSFSVAPSSSQLKGHYFTTIYKNNFFLIYFLYRCTIYICT